ncbi:MAG: peroxiredoxin [Hyphomonadaceae bacterium]
MSLLLGDTAPNFKAETTTGPIDFHDWIGDEWAVFFSHPADFTPVCTTELGYTARLKDEFAKRGAKAIVISVDGIEDHLAWTRDIEEIEGVPVEFPIIADPERKVASLYGMIHPKIDATATVRSVFVIDPNKKIRAMITYPQSVGRNFNEILRLLDSLQLSDQHKIATPVNWQPGEDVIIVPSLTDKDEIARLFPKGHTEVKWYLRTTPQPD